MRELAGAPLERLSRRGVTDAEGPLKPLGVEGTQGDPRLNSGNRQCVSRQAAGLKAAVLEAVEGELLDRGSSAVGVETNLAEEDTVGPRDRPFAHVNRVGAVKAVGGVAQAALDRLGATARLTVDLDPGDAEAGELGGHVRRDPAEGRGGLPVEL